MERDDRGPYGWTLYLELCFSLFRFLPSIIPAALIVGVGGQFVLFGLDGIGLLSDTEAERWYDGLIEVVVWTAILIAGLPVVWSVLTLYGLRGGYGLTARELDARPPSKREWPVIADAVQRVLAEAPADTVGPERWLVLDKVDLNAAVMGRAIYIHRALIHSEYLDAVIAHELGHLNNGDGRLTLALRRLVPPPFSFLRFAGNGCLPLLLMLCGGGVGLLMTTPWWNRYWRDREFLADRFAYECGQATGLIELLDLYQFFDVAVPFGFLWRDHPHDEERIDLLLGYLEDEEDTDVSDAGTASTAESRKEMKMPFWKRTRETKVTPVERKRYLEEEEDHDYAAPPAPRPEPLPVDSPAPIPQESDALPLRWLYNEPGEDTTDAMVDTEVEWIEAHGRSIFACASHGYQASGRGFVLLRWDDNPELRPVRQRFDYSTLDTFLRNLRNPRQPLDQDLIRQWDFFIDRVQTYDPAYQFIVMVTCPFISAREQRVGWHKFAVDLDELKKAD